MVARVSGMSKQQSSSGSGSLAELECLKAVAGPKAKEEYRRLSRKITKECFNLPTDPKTCPRLKWKKVGREFQLQSMTCRIKRCPRDEIEEGGM